MGPLRPLEIWTPNLHFSENNSNDLKNSKSAMFCPLEFHHLFYQGIEWACFIPHESNLFGQGGGCRKWPYVSLVYPWISKVQGFLAQSRLAEVFQELGTGASDYLH